MFKLHGSRTLLQQHRWTLDTPEDLRLLRASTPFGERAISVGTSVELMEPIARLGHERYITQSCSEG